MIAAIVDNNVLVHSRGASEPEKQARGSAWREHLWKTRSGRLSIQVLNEYYQVVTRKLRPGLPRNLARDEVRDLMLWQPLALNASVLDASYRQGLVDCVNGRCVPQPDVDAGT